MEASELPRTVSYELAKALGRNYCQEARDMGFASFSCLICKSNIGWTGDVYGTRTCSAELHRSYYEQYGR